MLKRRVNQNKGTINKELIQRLDKMDDEREYSPYDPIKRTTILHDDLFNNEAYEDADDDYTATFDNIKKESKAPLVIGVITVVGILGIALYFFTNIIK